MLDLNSVLHCLGWAFALKILYSVAVECKNGLYGFILPRLWALCFGKEDFARKFGEWGLVTGCTQGIGKEYAVQLAARGMNVVLVSRNKETLGKVAREIEERFKVKTEIIAVDFTDTRAAEVVVKEVARLKIDIGVLVNNVGMLGPHFSPFLELEEKTMRDMLTVNCASVTSMTHAFLPRMLELNKGAVVNISSTASFCVMPYLAEYCATKHFVSVFTEALRSEVSSSKVLIQEVDPGMTNTQMTQDFYPASSIEAPFPDTFVSSAIMSLGWTERTTGWWFHSFQCLTLNLIPGPLYSMFFNQVGLFQYKYATSKKKDN